MIPYILHVTVITTICFLFYKLLLQKETFYQLNRWILMGCLAVSFVLPLLPVPREWSWREEVPAATAPRPVATGGELPVTTGAVLADPQTDIWPGQDADMRFAQQEGMRSAQRDDKWFVQQGDAPSAQQTDTRADLPPTGQRASEATVIHPAGAGTDGSRLAVLFSLAVRWIFYVYLFGVLLFGLNFLFQLAVLLFQSYANPVIRDGRFRIVETGGNRAPCSFGNTIFINPASYDWETYNQILIHEKTHVSGGHTLDLLLAEIALVLQWFNPVAWWYRREVENNLEFLTDASVLRHKDIEISAYQLSLLRVSAPHLPFSITNNYNQSLLKRRIVMMNSKRSSRHTVWKYFFLLPIFTGLVCALNEPAAYGQRSKKDAANKATATSSRPADKVGPAVAASPAASVSPGSSVSPATSASPASSVASSPAGGAASEASSAASASSASEGLPAEGDTAVRPVQASGGEVSEASSSTPLVALSQPVSAVAPVRPQVAVHTVAPVRSAIPVNVNAVGPVIAVDIDDLTDGAWFVTSRDNKLWFELKAEEEDHSWSHTLGVEKSEINPFPGVGNVTFKLVREAGTITFTGQFDGQQGFGHFHFEADEAYFKFLQQQGVEELEGRRKMSFFSLNIKKDYVTMIQRTGFPHITSRELISFAAMHIDQEFLQYWKGSGLVDADDPRTLVSIKAMQIDRGYVEELKAAGYDHLTRQELMSLKSQHIDGAYIRSMGRGKDNAPIPVRELVSYKAMKIDSGYVNSLRKLGYTDLERRDITSLYSMHITADFIKGFQDIGLKDLSPHEWIRLKAMNITPEFVGEFKKLGFDNIPLSMLSSLKSMGVNAEYISKMREKGFVSKDLQKYIRLKQDFN